MRVIVILGMHRSGTSAVARVCNLLGADVGVHLLPPQEDNPTGFWELEEVASIHDELLSSLGSSWHATAELPDQWWQRPDIEVFKDRLIDVVQREFKDSMLLCLKDPRICRLMPLWKDIFKQLEWTPYYLLVIRNPLEVAQSLESRNGLHHRVSYLLWLRHMLEAERFTRDTNRAFIGYEDLLKDWRTTMESALTRLGLGDLRIDAAAAVKIDDFIQKDLRHYAATLDGLEKDQHHALIHDAFRNCLSAIRKDTTQLQKAFSALEEILVIAAPLYEPIIADARTKRVRLEDALSSLAAHCEHLEEKNAAVTSRMEKLQKKLAMVTEEAQARTAQINGLIHTIADRDSAIADLNSAIADRDTVIADRDTVIADRDSAIADRDRTVTALVSSTSWRMTTPLRGAMSVARRLRGDLRAVTISSLRRLFYSLPISDQNKLRLRSYYSRNAGFIARSQNSTDCAFDDSYDKWIAQYDTLDEVDRAGIKRDIMRFQKKPLIAVIMPVFNTPERFLRAAIQSVIDQLYDRWELCVADDRSTEPHVSRVIREYQGKDERIKAVFRKENGNISACSNSALALAEGEFVALLDHDDLLSEHALYWVALAINKNPSADIIYSDEDKVDEDGRRSKPYFKSDWNRDLFYCQNMINHLGVYRTSVVKDLAGFRMGFEGSQDYDLVLRVLERTPPENIVHIPHILYHWRTTTSARSFSQSQLPRAVSAARRAVQAHLERIGADAKVGAARNAEHYQRIHRPVPKPEPLVSLIVPTRDKANLLRQCIDGILSKTTYPALEVIIVNNGSIEPETKSYFIEVQNDPRVRVIAYDREFNYSAINNFAIKQAKGDIVGLINNDIVVINDDWLTELVSHAVRPDVGAVGAALYYPDDTIQHAGIVTGLGGVAGHGHKRFRRDDPGYFGRLKLTQNVSGVTGACLLARREVLLECGGLDEANLTVAFNDVDLCLKMREHGYLIVWTPYAELYHLESASRGLDVAPGKVERFNKEQAWMKDRWGAVLANDPYYNPNLSLEKENYSLAFPPRTNKPWVESMDAPRKKKVEQSDIEFEKDDVEKDPRVNTGIAILRELDKDAQEKTIVVLGLARGGTSMIAGALHHLGVYMGDPFNNITYEDRVLSPLVEAGRTEQVKDLIITRNDQYPIWGWKRPSSLHFIGELERFFRNPVYVVVFRDILSIASRNKISMLTDLIQNMRQSTNQYADLVKFIERSKAPCMLVSYDKALANSKTFVRELAGFVRLRDKQAMEAAINFIEPNPEQYLEDCRITRSTGMLERVSESKVSGWVKGAHDLSLRRILEVQLIINHKEVQRAKANLLRSDLVEKGIHPTGRCGFNFVLPNHLHLKDNDEVRVKTVHDIYELKNSPYKYRIARLIDTAIGRHDVAAKRKRV